MGLTCPIIREGDNLAAIVVESVLDAIRMPNNKFDICDRAVVGITESVVARSQYPPMIADMQQRIQQLEAELRNAR